MSLKQTTLDEFERVDSRSIEEHNREALKRIHETHVSKMADILNEIFRKLFDEDYVKRC